MRLPRRAALILGHFAMNHINYNPPPISAGALS
jgi:hypothetical protein